MKKVLCITFIFCIVITTVVASPFSLGMGNYIRHKAPFSTNDFPVETITNPASYRFGSDLRLKVFFLEITMNQVLHMTNDQNTVMGTGMMTLGVSKRLLGFLDFGVGIGPFYGVYYNNNESRLLLHFLNENQPYSWYYMDAMDFGDLLENSVVGYRLHVDARLGKISFGASVEIPTIGFTFGNADSSLLSMNLDRMRIGASAMYWLL